MTHSEDTVKNLASHFLEKEKELQVWFEAKSRGVQMPITSSVDIRNAGYKISVVDTNVFPAGFNNLCPHFSRDASAAFKKYFQQLLPSAKKILIVPENFTRNLKYFENVVHLEEILKAAGFETAIGFLGDLPDGKMETTLPNGKTIFLQQLQRVGTKVEVPTLKPDALLLNNDCSLGIPEILLDLAQPIYPSPHLGWHQRRKKHHFEIYCQLAQEITQILNTDCWHFCPITHLEKNVSVDNPADMQRVADQVDSVIRKTQKKYEQYGIDQKPYAFIKSNFGTFGLGVIHVESGEEILNLNRKGRQKLSASKGGNESTEFLIQEGIITIDSFKNAPIEPTLYFVGGDLVGGFFRVHEEKDNRSSLNAPGARFETLCLHECEKETAIDLHLHYRSVEDFWNVTRWLGQIAALAVGLEMQDLQSA